MKKVIFIVLALIFLITQFPVISSTNSVDYVILVREKYRENVRPLEEFKKEQGYRVKVFTLEEIEKETFGKDRAEKIRNFLKEKLEELHFKYVLLVGSYRYIPQPIFFPKKNTRDDSYERIPSDFYYANLTSDFDTDKDKTMGEYGEDSFSYFPDVFVGRIPFTDRSGIEKYVDSLRKYKSVREKNKVLLMGAMLWFKKEYGDYPKNNADGAKTMEILRKGIFKNLNSNVVTMYEKEGDGKSKYDFTYPLNINNVKKEINKNYNFIAFFGHGSSNGVYRRIWNDRNRNDRFDDGEGSWSVFLSRNLIEETGISNGVIFGMGCLTAETEKPNLAMTALRFGGVNYIGATRVAYGNPDSPISKEVLKFTERFFNLSESSGEALYLSKWDNALSINDFSGQHNFFVFNLFGDPSVSYRDEDYSLFPRNFSLKQGRERKVHIRIIRGSSKDSLKVDSPIPFEIDDDKTITFLTKYDTPPDEYFVNVRIGDYSTVLRVVVYKNKNLSDLNDDEVVDKRDLTIFYDAFLSIKGDKNYNSICDFNFDGKVDFYDFFIFSKNFGGE